MVYRASVVLPGSDPTFPLLDPARRFKLFPIAKILHQADQKTVRLEARMGRVFSPAGQPSCRCRYVGHEESGIRLRKR